MAVAARYLATLIAAALVAAVAAITPGFVRGLGDGIAAGELLANSSVVAIFWGALGYAVLFGLPSALLLQLAEWANALTAAAAGFLIGTIPTGIVIVLFFAADGLHFAAAAGVCGAVGGLAAWIVLRYSARVPWLWLLAVMAGAIALHVAS